MAFTGTATVVLVADNLVRITGLSLAGAAAGTISLAEGTGAGVELPAAFKPRPYVSGDDSAVSLIDSVEVSMNVVTAVTTLVPITVVKTGTTLATFLITFTNTTVATASAGLEIYIRHH
jgi:hypothetical protein